MIKIPEYFVDEKKKELKMIIKNECSNNCKFCTTRLCHGSREFGFDTKESILRLIALFSKKGFDKIKFIAFEPLEHPDIIEIISFASGNGFNSIEIMTNGRRFCNKEFSKEIVKRGLTYADILLLGHEPKIHDSVTQKKGSFEETLNGIKILNKLNFNFDVNTVVVKQNFRYLFEILDFCERNQINFKSFTFVEPSMREIDAYREVVCKMEDIMKSLESKREKFPKNYLKKILNSLNHVPVCLIKKHFPNIQLSVFHKNLENWENNNNSTGKYHYKQKQKCKILNECKFYEFHSCLFKQYIEIFGHGEFEHFKHNAGQYDG